MGVRDANIVYFDGVLKLLGILHGTFGGLLIVMGIIVRVAVDHWTSVMLVAIWTGVLFAATGAIAVVDSNLEKADNSRKYYLTDFLLFSVISLLLSVLVVVCYSMAVYTAFSGEELGSFDWYSYEKYHSQALLRVKIFSIIVLVLGVSEFVLSTSSVGYVAHAYKRDQRRKLLNHDDAVYSYDNITYDSRL